MITDEYEDGVARYYQADQVPNPLERTAAFAEYLKIRDDWPCLQLAKNEYDNWDIVIRVDGGYGREDAERMLRWTALQVARIQCQNDPQIAHGDAA